MINMRSRNVSDELAREYYKKAIILRDKYNLNMKQIADRFGLNYEHFRTIFKRMEKKSVHNVD